MIRRDPEGATQRVFDVAVIGGGIHGAAMFHAAAQSGLSAFLCETNDFGGGTSRQSLRIVHGGLRYLQTLDLRRFRQSVRARRGFARTFPSLVRPLECLMPLYGNGMKRPAVMRLALWMNDVLSADRNAGVVDSNQLPPGRVLDPQQTQEAFPQVRSEGLAGAASWSDYFMLSSERMLIEYIRAGCRHDAIALNYARCGEISGNGKRVSGVRVEDRITRRTLKVRARVVVNCCGPQVQTLLQGREAHRNELFAPSLAFNLLLDVKLPGSSALAVAAPTPDAQVLFLVPQGDSVLAGTMHRQRAVGTIEASPSEEEIEDFLAQLRAAVRGFDVQRGNVKRIFTGLLPAAASGSAQLLKQEVLRDHGASGGLRGLYSIVGIKYTTAPDVAKQMLRLIGMSRPGAEYALTLSPFTPLLTDARTLASESASSLRGMLRQVALEEAVQSVEDILLRRSNWSVTEIDLDRLRRKLGALMGDHWQAKAERP